VMGTLISVCSDLMKGGVAGGVGGNTGDVGLLAGAGLVFFVSGFGDSTLELLDLLLLGSFATVFAFVTPDFGLGERSFEL